MSSADRPNDRGRGAIEFLLEEYRYLTDSLWKNEQTGETRVNMLIGIATALIAGLAVLTTAKRAPGGEQMRLIFVASFLALLVLGIVTLFRLLKRNEATDRFKKGCDTIRQIIKDRFDDDGVLIGYYPFGRKQGIHRRKFGGLTHLVAAINSLFVAGLAGSIAYPRWGPALTCLSGVVAFIASMVVQILCINRREVRANDKPSKKGPTHAGGLVYRLQGDAVEYLLVGPKKEVPNEWLLPKGHIRDDEVPSRAALREIREETGVVARLICFVGYAEFETPNEMVKAKFYLMQRLSEAAPSESRRVGWFEFDEARKLLTHDQNRYLLEEAERKRARLAARLPRQERRT